VVADEDLLAVVEPVNPHASVDAIRGAIEESIAMADEADEEEDDDEDEDEGDVVGSLDAEDEDDYTDELPEVEPSPPPSPDEVRAGFARIGSRLAAGSLN
jgi:hypothetical protein